MATSHSAFLLSWQHRNISEPDNNFLGIDLQQPKTCRTPEICQHAIHENNLVTSISECFLDILGCLSCRKKTRVSFKITMNRANKKDMLSFCVAVKGLKFCRSKFDKNRKNVQKH